MAKLILGGPQNSSLDGVVQDPDGGEGWSHGGWFVEHGGADLEPWGALALEDALQADAWLLGRRSYTFFSERWQPREGALADRLNALPKHVVSSTLTDPSWQNTTVLGGDAVAEVTRLKAELEGEIVVPAGYQLARTLLEHGLVDGLRLVVFPVVVGTGRRLFSEGTPGGPLRLAAARTIGEGLVFLSYELAGRTS
jgi:dihydrofolate reductase